MPFPFTFSLSAPGISNPFSAPPLPPKAVSCNPGYPAESSHSNANSNAKRRHPSPSPSQNDNSRGLKRGWEPSFAEPSQSMPTLASSNGYLDTPAKYRDIAEQQKKGLGAGFNRDDFEQIEQNSTADEQPPTKRRRGLAGSIVSTAVSAALIGTAVGLTVYRLWRDRGKDCVQPVITVEDASTPPPPPPYSSSDPQGPPTLNVVPATPRTARKSRNHQVHSNSARRRPRRVHHQSQASIGPGPSSTFPPTQPAFDFSSPKRSPVLSHAQSEEDQVDVDIDAVDDQMDWIGSKLSSLIEEGKKALGKQVVVMSEAKEDEVDDGSGEWVEEEDGDEFGRNSRSRGRSTVSSRSGSTSRRRAPVTVAASGSLSRRAGAGMSIHPPPYGGSASASSSASPRRGQFAMNMNADAGLPSSLPININAPTGSLYETLESWESPEVRESMERARARARERRAQQAQGGLGSSFS